MQPTAQYPNPSLCWSVSALIQAITDSLKARFSTVSVRGEISGFSRASSGHCYFILKDDNSQIRCAMFQRTAQMLSFSPENGDDVEVSGRLTVYGQRGELQLTIENMRPLGQGRLLEQFQQLKKQLEKEGLFDPARKCPLPVYPKTIGIISSLQAAALQDILTSLKRRAPHVRAIIYPSSVQGPQAVAELTNALAVASKRKEVDTLLLCRGGGSLEDLWCFNEEAVVRAIATCPLPVISGVGHETDFTLSDFAADIRAPTPTAATELATPSQDELSGLIRLHEQGLLKRLRYRLENYMHRLDRASLSLQNPATTLRTQQQKLKQLSLQLNHAAKQVISQKQYPVQTLEAKLPALGSHIRQKNANTLQQLTQRWQHQASRQFLQRQQDLMHLHTRLQANNPLHVLSRGYAWISNEQGDVISSAKQLSAGDIVQAQFADGKAKAIVTQSVPDLFSANTEDIS